MKGGPSNLRSLAPIAHALQKILLSSTLQLLHEPLPHSALSSPYCCLQMYWHHVVNSNFQGAEYFICFSFKSPLFRVISGVLSSEKSGAGNETKIALIFINMKVLSYYCTM